MVAAAVAVTTVVAAPVTAGPIVELAATIGSSGAPEIVVTAVASGPAGWVLLGAVEHKERVYTWDCWKPVLHDESVEPSKRMLLKDVVTDPRVKNVTSRTCSTKYQQLSAQSPLVVKNIWDEQFRIDFMELPTKQLAAHAVRIN